MGDFLRIIQYNTLAVVVLVALIISAIMSLIFVMRDNPVLTPKSKATLLLSLFTLLGFPVVFDLIKTIGITRFFAILVLITFILNLGIPYLYNFLHKPEKAISQWYVWATPILVFGGLVVATYLTYVEITSTSVVCGADIPGCGTVQTSPYAWLFGILPIGIIGVIGYLAILVAWLFENRFSILPRKLCGLAQWGLCFFGVIFSVYLTYLEAFVIRATCAWCILSAVFMILLLWVSTPKAQSFMAGNR
jgi:uncharacterized membrane protein